MPMYGTAISASGVSGAKISAYTPAIAVANACANIVASSRSPSRRHSARSDAIAASGTMNTANTWPSVGSGSKNDSAHMCVASSTRFVISGSTIPNRRIRTPRCSGRLRCVDGRGAAAGDRLARACA